MNRLSFPEPRRGLQVLWNCPLCMLVALGLAGCDDPSADLQTRLTYAQKELDAANAEIQNLRAEKDKPKEPQPSPAVEAAPPAVSEEGFREEAKNFARQLEAEMRGATVSDPSYSDLKKVATYTFWLTTADGSKSQRQIVASATPDGRWIFPAAGRFVSELLAAAPSPEPLRSEPPARPVVVQPPQSPTRPATIDPLGPASETKNVDFGDKGPRRVPDPDALKTARPPQPTVNVPPRPPSPNLPGANEEKVISFERKK